MANRVTLIENTLEPSTWKTVESVADVREFLVDHFGIWPENARIYLDHVANNADITPYDEAGIDRLGRVTGHFYIVVYPEGIELILVIVAVVIAAVTLAFTFLNRPSSPSTPNQAQASPNNQLADRQNTARPNERIPDIFGQLWATFDLLAVPYTMFVNNIEYEHCYMCVGRGSYDFGILGGVLQIRDDITPLSAIDGASAKVYGPNTSPNGAGAPILTVGPAFMETVLNLQKFGGINGQLLAAPNKNAWITEFGLGGGSLCARYPNILENNQSISFTAGFQAGDIIYIGGRTGILFGNVNDDIFGDTGGLPSIHLGGVYVVQSVSLGTDTGDHIHYTGSQIVLSSPATVNANWNQLAAFAGGVSSYSSVNLIANNPFWVGSAWNTPIFINRTDVNVIIANFIAEQGMYQVNSVNGVQSEIDATIGVGITPCNSLGDPEGSEILTNIVVSGSHIDRVGKGATGRIAVVPGSGGFLIRAHRATNTNIAGNTTVTDEIKWRDLYLGSVVTASDFGNVTTIQTLIKATPSATAIKQRKMNALVTRMLPLYINGAFTSTLFPTKNAGDIICAMALDPFIGNRTLDEIDVVGIYALLTAGGIIEKYFAVLANLSAPTEFCYTFDDLKTSFEEALGDVANAIFCVAFRRGNIISLSFEQQTPNSVLLFNHRNKIPKSETRTLTFGALNDNDGITLQYVEPNAPNYPNLDTVVTLYFPTNQSAINPKKITLIGVRNVQQATLLGWRLYQKLLFQNTTIQFDATVEAALLVAQDRILVADNTRSDTQDGEVIAQDALLLTLSQKVTFDSRFHYTIFLQAADGSIESIPCAPGPNVNQVVLGGAPSLPCVIDPDRYARTTYLIVNDAPVRTNAFLLGEKKPKNGSQFELTAINYDDNYYAYDNSLKTNVDFAGIFIEVMTAGIGPNTDVAGQFLEVMTNPAAPNTDVAGLYIEVMTH